MRLITTKHIVILGLLVILLGSCARVPESNQQIVVLANGDALRKDAAEYARLFNVSPDEALRRMKLQREIGKLDARIAKGEPGTYAGAWIRHEPTYGVEINIAGDPSVVAKYVAGTSLAKLVKTHRVEKSLKQLELEQTEATATLSELGIPSESEIDVQQNRAEVYVLDMQKVEQVETARSAAATALNEVSVNKIGGFSQSFVNAYAGYALGNCTAGYTVFDGNGLYGITTAGHCNNAMDYGSSDLEFIRQWWTGPYDFQWHKRVSSSLVFKPRARDNQPTSQGTAYYREMYSPVNRQEQTIGTVVCKYGIWSGFTCGRIASKTFNPSNPPYNSTENNSATFIRVTEIPPDRRVAGPGDSGGPVYEGHAAFGLIKGGFGYDDGDGSCNPFCGDLIYMAINYVTDTGLRVFYAPR